jgi:hypothetical protein
VENNWMAIINEFAALLYLYIVLPLTDFMPVPEENPLEASQQRDQIGFILATVISVTVILNILKYLYYC